MTEKIFVNCRLSKSREFVVIFDNGEKCNGTLTQEGLSSNTKMKMHLERGCLGQETDQVFACLDTSVHGYFGNQMTVTESLDTSSRLSCWIFPSSPGDKFYLLPASQ